MHFALEHPGETLSLVGRHIRISGTAFHSSGAPVSVKALIGGREETLIWGLPNVEAFDGTEASYMSGFTKVVDLGPEAKQKEFEIELRFAAEGEARELRRTVAITRDKTAARPSLLAAGAQADFRAFGDAFLELMVAEGLKPSSRVIEVGPGAGRASVAIARRLDSAGSLLAFDVDASAVEFCNRNISGRFPRAEFRHQDVQHRIFNPTGSKTAAKGVLDAKSSGFDFAVAWSVFPRLAPDDFKLYLRELARVLKPGGKAIFSVFLHGPGYEKSFVSLGRGFWTTNIERPESAIAVEPGVLTRIARDAGFKRVEVRREAGAPGPLMGQDVIVAVR